jgi:hypothetical protein
MVIWEVISCRLADIRISKETAIPILRGEEEAIWFCGTLLMLEYEVIMSNVLAREEWNGPHLTLAPAAMR